MWMDILTLTVMKVKYSINNDIDDHIIIIMSSSFNDFWAFEVDIEFHIDYPNLRTIKLN